MEPIFFDNWGTLLRTLIIGVMAYVSLIALLRISGRRTLSKMNSFDFLVTVSLGSILAGVLLNQHTNLFQGGLAFAILIGLQYAVTWSSVRAPWIRNIITGEPAILLYKGSFLPSALKRARVTEDEIRAMVRLKGLDTLGEVEAVVLETDGSLSVVHKSGGSGASSLEGVKIPGPKSIKNI